MDPIFQLLFLGNVLGYVSLVVALYFVPPLARFRPVVRSLLIAFAVAAIISYFWNSVLDSLGNIDKAIEFLLIVLTTVDAGMEDVRDAVLQLVIGIVAGIGLFGLAVPLILLF